MLVEVFVNQSNVFVEFTASSKVCEEAY
jgi:hypothetical protein